MKGTGIKYGYPRLSKVFGSKLTSYIQLVRPLTGTGAFIAGFCLTLAAFAYHAMVVDLKIAGLAGIALMLLQFAGQALNQSIREEVEIDRINGKVYRPTVRGVISLFEAKLFGTALLALGLGVSFTVSFTFGIMCIIIAFFAIFYTYPPIRAKRFFMANNVWQGISRGFMPVVATWSIAGNPLHPLPLALGLVIAVWCFGAQTSKDINDVAGDAKFGIRTLPVVLGEKAFKWMEAFMYGSFALLFGFILSGLLPLKFTTLLTLAVPTYFITYTLKKGYKLKLTENLMGWTLFYMTLGLWFILSAVLLALPPLK